MAKSEATIEVRLNASDLEKIVEFNDRIAELERMLDQRRELVTEFATRVAALEEGAAGYQHDCDRYRTRIGELEDKLTRVEMLAAKWEGWIPEKLTSPEATAGHMLREALGK